MIYDYLIQLHRSQKNAWQWSTAKTRSYTFSANYKASCRQINSQVVPAKAFSFRQHDLRRDHPTREHVKSLPLLSLPISFFTSRQHGNQHTNSLSATSPRLSSPLLSFSRPPRLVISDRKGEKCGVSEKGRRRVAVSSVEHKVFFVFRFRDLPRTSIAAGAVVRAFLHYRPIG